MPLFIPFGRKDRSILSRVSTLFEKPWALFLLFIPIAGMAILAEIFGIGYFRIMGGWDPLSYFIFFVFGYLIFSNTQLQNIIRKYSTACLISSLILTAFYIYLEFGTGIPEISAVNIHNSIMRSDSVNEVFSSRLSLSWAWILILRSLLAWCWIISILGLSARFLNFKNKFLGYANEAVLPFYILHQTILLIIGFYAIQLSIGIASKYIIITSSSFLVIMTIYELLIRRINLFRFLFGMKLIKRLKSC